MDEPSRGGSSQRLANHFRARLSLPRRTRVEVSYLLDCQTQRHHLRRLCASTGPTASSFLERLDVKSGVGLGLGLGRPCGDLLLGDR